jgi:RNA polymerase sigma factor (sigma-70 family)
MMSDLELLDQYARGNRQEAFAALVDRHVKLVYSTALRQVRSPELAEEVTQSVFSDLARNAGKLEARTILTPWLYQVTRRTAIDLVRRESRRQVREQVALEMIKMNSNAPEWTAIEPLLDEAMEALNPPDRAAILLRYFEDKSLREVGQTLGTSEDAAQKRVSRALGQLREFFARRGQAVGVGGLAAVISANAVQAAPSGLAASVAVAALQGTVATAAPVIPIETTLKIMAWTKLKTAGVACILAIVAAGTATIAVQRAKTPANSAGAKAVSSPFAFAGYTTPEDSVESMIWAASVGDMDKLADGLTPEDMERFKAKMAGKSPDEIRAGLVTWANAMVGYKVTQKDVISDDEVHVHIHATPSAEALHSGKAVMVMRKIGNEWKRDGDAN